LASFDKAGGTSNAGTVTVDNTVMYKTAKAGSADSDETGACRCKRTAEKHPATAG